MEFQRGDRVRLVAGQSAKGKSDGPGTVTHLPCDPGYSGYDDDAWVQHDNGYEAWQPVVYLIPVVERNDKVALTEDYERVKKGATGIVTHLDGDPCEYPGGGMYRSPKDAVWVDFGANGGRLWVAVEVLEVIQSSAENCSAK